MFIDEVSIKVVAGKGGDGVVSFRRENTCSWWSRRRGRGRRGSVYLEADEGYTPSATSAIKTT